MLRGCLVGILAFASAQACSAESDLEGLECIDDNDCWRTQTCVRTPTQKLYGANGRCSESGDCVIKEQHGCGCDINDVSQTVCDFTLTPTSDDVTTCICCNADEPTTEFEGQLACDRVPEDTGTETN